MKAIKLVKFGKRPFIEEFYSQGKVFMNTVDYFRKHEDENCIGDKHEGLSHILRSIKGEIKIDDGSWSSFTADSFLIRNENDNGNLYCLTALWEDAKTNLESSFFELDERILGFGNAYALVHNPKLFISKLKSKLTSMGLETKIFAVKYEQFSSYEGQYGIFTKPNEYSYQNEVRVFVKTEGNTPIEIELGSMKELVTVHAIEELFQKR